MTFNSTLSAADWDARLGGWRCEGLTLPGATLTAVFANGQQADPRQYRVSDSVITWSATNRPEELVVKISLTKDLPELEREKLKLEREKVTLENEKFRSDKRWKLISATGAVTAALLSFAGA